MIKVASQSTRKRAYAIRERGYVEASQPLGSIISIYFRYTFPLHRQRLKSNPLVRGPIISIGERTSIRPTSNVRLSWCADASARKLDRSAMERGAQSDYTAGWRGARRR